MDDAGNLPQTAPASGRRRWLSALAIVAALLAAYFAGRESRPPTAIERDAKRVLYYVDPMHPAYRSDKPGTAPDCGMELQPVYNGGDAAAAIDSIRLTPAEEQAVRLETEPAQQADGARHVHTAGRVVPDEALTYSVSAGAEGWVRRVFSGGTGSRVKRGQALAAFFSKEVSGPQQAYLYALQSYERLQHMPSPPADQLAAASQQLASALDYLRYVGMGDPQIEELGRMRMELPDINLAAPGDGRILERRVAVGQRFMKGELLYRIANLERVWVMADVHPGDAALLNGITSARITAEGLPPMEAKAGAAAPQFEEQGRTGKMRLEVPNPRETLVPGMIVNVELETAARPALTVSADAVIDSGMSRRVFVAMGGGRYEPRDVETGRQEGDRVEIRSGLKSGERVVTAAAFLLDSESRMKTPSGLVTDAECGMKVALAKARRLERKGATYYFCSDACQQKFAARQTQ
ncbi:MAG: efflux RND transporter periplasmic adaptor subunit [Bryobacteraceae bacterium]